MMNIGSLYKITVRIDCKSGDDVNQGSGAIIYDKGIYYVMTAGHCLLKNDSNVFDISEITLTSFAYSEPLLLTVLDIDSRNDYSDDNDYALIQIDKPKIDFDFVNLIKRCDTLLDEESYFSYGYNEYSPKGRLYKLSHYGQNQWHLNNDNITNQPVPAMNVMGGNSGAPIFFQKADMFFYVGYMKRLNHIDGIGNDIIVHPASYFDQVLSNESKEDNFFKLVHKWTEIDKTKADDDIREILTQENIEYLHNLERKIRVLYPNSEEARKKVDQFLNYYAKGLVLKTEIGKTNHVSNKLSEALQNVFDQFDETRSMYFEGAKDARDDLNSVIDGLLNSASRVLDIKDGNNVSRAYAQYNVAEKLMICSLDYKKQDND